MSKVLSKDMTNVPVVVIGRDNCVQCDFTKRTLEAAGIEFMTAEIGEYQELASELGFTSLPIVYSGKGLFEPFAGFRPDKIEEIKDVLSHH